MCFQRDLDMNHENRKDLSNVRLEHAKDCLESAKREFAAGGYNAAANRSYYAIFHSMRAVLALDGIDMKHHSGIISEFRRLYIKTGIFNEEFSDIIGDAFDIRTEADYDDFYLVDIESIKRQIENAEIFLDNVDEFLKNK